MGGDRPPSTNGLWVAGKPVVPPEPPMCKGGRPRAHDRGTRGHPGPGSRSGATEKPLPRCETPGGFA